MPIAALSLAASNPRLSLPHSLAQTLKPLTVLPKSLSSPLPSSPYPSPSPSSSSSSSSSDAASSSTSSSSSKSCLGSVALSRRKLLAAAGCGVLASTVAAASEAEATRIEYYATVGEPLCDMSFAKSGLGFCDIALGTGVQAPRGELINIHYTARFADGTVFDSSYKRGRPLTMRIGVGKVLRGLDQGILGGGGVPPMLVGGKRKLMIPPMLAYGPEPAGCFSGDCNIPSNATLLYDILFVGIYK